MKQLVVLVVAMSLIMMMGCVPSLNPFYSDADVVLDDQLLIGEWTREGEDAIWTVTRGKGNQFYEVTTRENGRAMAYRLHLVQMGNGKYLDLIAVPFRTAGYSIYDAHFIPAHMLYQVESTQPKLVLRGLEPQWLEKHLAQQPDSIAFKRIHDTVVLTAETKDLQAFFRRAAGMEGALSKPLVFGKKSKTAFVRGADESIAAIARPLRGFPAVGPYEVLAGDFHMHTTRSDGRVEPRERIREAWKYGYDAVAITDHRTHAAYDEVAQYAESLGLVLVRGLESGVHQKEHYVILGISDRYEPRNAHSWAENPGGETVFYQDQMRRVQDDGGLVIWAHPHTGFRDPTRWGIEQGIIQAVEVKNAVVGSGWATQQSHGTWCYPNAFEWALENNLALLANSDIHAARGDGPQPVTLLLVRQRTARGVLDAIRERRTIAWFDGMLWGRKDLLASLLLNTEKATRTVDASGATLLSVENRGPVPLKAALLSKGSALGSIALEPYGKVLIESQNPPAAFDVRWENVWITPKENLTTTLELEAR